MIHLTGRITQKPNDFVNAYILEPHFSYEVENLLKYYIEIELVMNKEYERLGLISNNERIKIDKALTTLDASIIKANPLENMSDISFAIEKYVEKIMEDKLPDKWHSDRSRNDIQSCAQIMLLRDQLLNLESQVSGLIKSLINKSYESIDKPIPGRTHYQPAQIITPAFYFISIVEELTHIRNSLLNIYDYVNQCPLGAGSMAGLEYEWNRAWIARELGFIKPKNTALSAIASKQGQLEVAAIQANLGVLISRFATDLIDWLVNNYIDLPDELSGISSAMPQKKNYPIMERIRGQNSHMISFYNGFTLSQKNTPFTNLVETSKEGSKYILELFKTTNVNLNLLKIVIENMNFNEDNMLKDCSNEFFGGFTLANYLSKEYGIPNRKAQSIVGAVIRTAIENNLTPMNLSSKIIQEVSEKHGFSVYIKDHHIQNLFSVKQNLNKQTLGSTNPCSVESMLRDYTIINKEIDDVWDSRKIPND